MKYVIVTIEWCLSKGIIVPEHARRSIDSSKVILHYDFIEPVLNETDEIECYEHNSSVLSAQLDSAEWTNQEEGV